MVGIPQFSVPLILLLSSALADSIQQELSLLEQFEPPEPDLGTCAWPLHSQPLSTNNGTCSPLVDNVTAEEEEEYTPWSFAPTCAEFRRKATAIGQPSTKTKYCTFTSVNFRGGRSISLVTTPELAASVAADLDDSVVPPSLRDHPTSWMNGTPEAEYPYEVKDVHNRGKSCFARRKIKAWETISVGYPVFMAQMDFMDVLKPDQITTMLVRGIGQLPIERQAEILGLARSEGGGVISGILKANVFGAEIDGVDHMALVPETSRFNHGCRPNAFWRYEKEAMALQVIAMRDIKSGEEITFSYAPLGHSYEERQTMLREWGFACKCDICRASRSAIQQSDARRELIHQIHSTLQDDSSLTIKQIDTLAGEWVGQVERESLWPQLVPYYEVIARAYLRAKDASKAEKYLDLCEEMSSLRNDAKHLKAAKKGLM